MLLINALILLETAWDEEDFTAGRLRVKLFILPKVNVWETMVLIDGMGLQDALVLWFTE